MKNVLLTSFLLCACTVFADGYVATPPKLARSLTDSQIDEAVKEAPAGSNVGVPEWYAKQVPEYREMGTNTFAQAAVPVLSAVIADSRKNILELEGLTDEQVATLYLAQMMKPVDVLQAIAPTNSMEYLIGAGMRQDLAKQKGSK